MRGLALALLAVLQAAPRDAGEPQKLAVLVLVVTKDGAPAKSRVELSGPSDDGHPLPPSKETEPASGGNRAEFGELLPGAWTVRITTPGGVKVFYVKLRAGERRALAIDL